MLTSRLAAHPRRTLIAVLLFVVLAGVVDGPVAGALGGTLEAGPGEGGGWRVAATLPAGERPHA